MSFAAGRKRGLTLVEVLVIIMVITILAGTFVPAATKRKQRALRIQCVNNLKECGIAFRVWSGDQTPDFPMQHSVTKGGTMEFSSGPNAFRHFQVMSNELTTPKVLFCPADSERNPATTFDLKALPGEIPFTSNSNLSYFVGLDAEESDPQRLLTGDRNITNGTPLKDGVLELAPNHSPGWTDEIHRKMGNVALADGSVQVISSMGLPTALSNMPAFTNRLQMPVLGQ